MEPLAALGLACNVLQLVDTAIACGKVVHKLHQDGSTSHQNDLTAAADTMDTVVAGLQTAPGNANVQKSAVDPQVTKLLTRATELCTSLRALIKKCQPQVKDSLRSVGSAAFNMLVHKSEIESLAKELETCRSSLVAIFTAATQYVQGNIP